VNLLGNLDCEAAWAGAALPEPVRRRISLYAALFAACAPPSDDGAPHELWAPAAIDPARLIAHPGWTPPRVRARGAGEPAAFDQAWADPAARAANDRSRTLAIAQALGVALSGAAVVASVAELDAAVAGFAGRPWVCKARWTAAGRDRVHGAGPAAGELRVRLGRMFERLGPLVLEPWLDRVADFGACGELTPTGEVRVAAPHRLVTDPRGGFVGIALAPAVEPAIAEPIREAATAAATRLAAETGYHGRFAVDAFVYRDGGAQHLHPLCELNARTTFGWIARALGERLGIARLGFDAPPAGATVLIAPGDDRVTAWCA
jgi:hypothetical protein